MDSDGWKGNLQETKYRGLLCNFLQPTLGQAAPRLNFKENRWTSTVNLGFYLLAPWNICIYIYIIPAIFSAVGSAIPSPQLYLINLPEYPEWDPKMCPSSVWGMVLLRTGFEWLKFFTRIGSRENSRGNHCFPSIHSGVPSISPWFKQITGCIRLPNSPKQCASTACPIEPKTPHFCFPRFSDGSVQWWH